MRRLFCNNYNINYYQLHSIIDSLSLNHAFSHELELNVTASNTLQVVTFYRIRKTPKVKKQSGTSRMTKDIVKSGHSLLESPSLKFGL